MSTLPRTPEYFPKMKVRGRNRKRMSELETFISSIFSPAWIDEWNEMVAYLEREMNRFMVAVNSINSSLNELDDEYVEFKNKEKK